MIYTRAEYISDKGDDFDKHRKYYAQYVNKWTIDAVARFIGHEALMASTDKHLNDIPLGRWDHCTVSLPLNMRFAAAGDCSSLGGLVCVAKEAARQYIEAQ
jgi:hypothetical protein